jgi:hypothetical protein
MPIPIVLLPGTLPSNYCYPENPQEYNVDLFTRASGTLEVGFTGLIIRPDEPTADQRGYAWLHSISNKIYLYQDGYWSRAHEIVPGTKREWVYYGLESEVETLDGGTPGALGALSGPIWEVDHDIDGKFLIGPGSIPTSSPAATVDVGASIDSNGMSGAYSITLTEAQGASGTHTHAFGISELGGDSVFLSKIATPVTVPSYHGYFVAGDDPLELPETTADLFTLPSGSGGTGTTTVAHSNMPPFIGRFLLRRTIRTHVFPPN